MELATRRLIDAAAALPPADRALLSLWTQRGLDDVALARMTGVKPPVIQERRRRIVERLSAELGLPAHDVAGPLTAMAASSAAALGTEPKVVNGNLEVEPATPVTEAQPEPEITAVSISRGGRRRRPLGWVVVVSTAAILVLLALAATSGVSSPPRRAVAPVAAAPTAAATPAPTATSGPRTPVGAPRALAALPGGSPTASGSVSVTRSPTGLILHVRVTGLPTAGADHYEVWLYNSIVDSRALGRLPTEDSTTFALPPAAGHYSWIDISRQPPGSTQPSGASVLRAPAPGAG